MHILCLNGWGGKLHQELIDYLTSTRPDVLCLQEVVHTASASTDWLEYRDQGKSLQQRSRFFSEVCKALPEHNAIFCPAAQGELWEGDKAHVSQWGLASFIHESLPVIAQHHGFVHGVYAPHDFGDHPRSRNAHVFRVYDYVNDYPVCIAHLHGLRDLAGKQDTPARLAQANRLRELVQSVVQEGDRLVVCGDFNVLPESQTFMVLASIGLTELVTSRGHKTTRTSHYKKPERFADYMFVNKPLADARFEVITHPEVSDHCPLSLWVGNR